jgi:type IV secretion system protein VirB9
MLIAANPVSAEVVPTAGEWDSRIREIIYNPKDVIRVTAFYGISTHIQLSEKEEIVSEGVSMGDDAAWNLVISGKRHIFLKPVARVKPETNLVVITNKRIYQFQLMVSAHDAATFKQKGKDLVYSLHFKYPEDFIAETAAKALADEKIAKARDIKRRLEEGRAGGDNLDYWINGSPDIAPTRVSDDGRFMYLTFGNNRDMPSIFEVNKEDGEALVNTTVEGNTIIVQRTYRKLILRKGIEIACLINKSFDVNNGKDNITGTVSGSVQRVLKGDK